MTGETELNAAVIQRRLVAITERLDELDQLGTVTAHQMAEDWLVRAAVERVLTQLVELAAQVNTHLATACGRVPPSGYRESFITAGDVGAIPTSLAAKIGPSAGLRNILVHEYLDADLGIVAASATDAVVDYRAYVREVARWLKGRTGR